MRSELIFRAQEKVTNRFRLCQTASKVTRCLYFHATTPQDAIIDALVRISHVPCLRPSNHLVEAPDSVHQDLFVMDS